MKYRIEEIKNKILCGDTLKELKKIPSESIDMVITSPPYFGLRSYDSLYNKEFSTKAEAKIWISQKLKKDKDYFSKIREIKDINEKIVGYKAIIYSKFIKKNQVGLENTPQDYINKIIKIAKEIKRILKKTGSFWLNIGDSYNTKSGSGMIYGNLDNQQEDEYGVSKHRHTKRGISKYPTKCLFQIPQRIAIALTDEVGLTLRNDIIWAKQVLLHKDNRTVGNVMPTSSKDRFNTAYEHLFFFTKNKKYYFELNSVRLPHQTETLERYQRAVNLGATQTQGKIFEDGVDKPMQAPKTFRENFGKDKNYKGKFSGFGEESENYGSPRARNERLSKVPSANTGFFNKEPYKDNNPHRSRIPNSKNIVDLPQSAYQGETNAQRLASYRDFTVRKGRKSNNSELRNRNWMPIKSKTDETAVFFQEQKKQGGNVNLVHWKPKKRLKTQDEDYKIGMRNAPEPGESNAFNIQGKNLPDIFQINTQPTSIKHFAVMPLALLERPIKTCLPDKICKKCGHIVTTKSKKEGTSIYSEQGKPEGIERSEMKWGKSHPNYNPRWWNTSKVTGENKCKCRNPEYDGGIILDPFFGAGTTAIAQRLYCPSGSYIGIEINPQYVKLSEKRIREESPEQLGI